MADKLRNRLLLERTKLSVKLNFDRHPGKPLIANLRLDAMCFEQRNSVSEATPRQSDVVGEIIAARDHTRLPVSRQTHCLRLIELWILECGQPKQAIEHRGRQVFLFDVDEICTNDLNAFRK